jgi:signal transduction histidine kinase
MQWWRKIELEWKVIILTVGLLAGLGIPLHNLYTARMHTTLAQSSDPSLEPLLRRQLDSAPAAARDSLIAAIERNRQWQALVPIIIREQSRAFIFSALLLGGALLVVAVVLLKMMTRPLKQIALHLKSIGRGQPAVIVCRSGGALGTVERAAQSLQQELTALREQARVQGMESAWQDIARVMAHEIKNPLTPIRLTLDRIEEKSVLKPQVDSADLQNFLRRINDNIDALERLVNQFRSFSKEPEAQL